MSLQITSKYIKLVSFLSNQKEEFKKEAENSNNSMSIRNMFGTMELEIEQLLRSVDEEIDPDCDSGSDCLSPY